MRDAAIDIHRSPARGASRSRASEAPPLDDMVGEGPVSRAAPRRGGITSATVAAQRLGGGRLAAARGRKAPGLVARLRGRIPRVRPLKILTIGAFGVALVGIVANAMVFQRGHHPTPLFGLGQSADGAPGAAERSASAAPPPPPAPAEKTGTIPTAPVAPAAPVELAPPPAAAAQARPGPAHRGAAKPQHVQAEKAKPSEAKAATAHPRPGHAASEHAKAEPDAKADPVARLLAGTAHPAKSDAKAAKPEGKADAKEKAAGASPAHPHHRVVAAGTAKPAAKTE